MPGTKNQRLSRFGSNQARISICAGGRCRRGGQSSRVETLDDRLCIVDDQLRGVRIAAVDDDLYRGRYVRSADRRVKRGPMRMTMSTCLLSIMGAISLS